MLSEKQLHNYFNSLKPHFSQYIFNRKPIKMSDNNLKANILSLNNHRLLGVSYYPMSVKALVDYDTILMNTFYNTSQKDYNHTIDPWTPWFWTRRNSMGEWSMDANIDSEEFLYKLILISQKIIVLDNIHFIMEMYRKPMENGLSCQDSIYTSKYLESKHIIQNKVESDPLWEYPFTSGYAKVSDISLQEAAKRIILQYDMWAGTLSENESLRVEYTNLIRKEKDITRLKKIFNDYETVTCKYGSL